MKLINYQKALLPQIVISLAISSGWFLFPPEWDNPFRIFSFMMFLYSCFCGLLFFYYDYDQTSGGKADMSDQDWAIDFLNGLDKNKLQALLKVCALITNRMKHRR